MIRRILCYQYENNIMNLRKLKLLAFAISLIISSVQGQSTLISGMDNLHWEKIMPGVWKASVGEMSLNPLEYANSADVSGLEALGEEPFPFDSGATRSLITSSRTSIRLPLSEREKIYGLGLEFEGINRRGNVYTLKVDHYGGVKGYTHAPIPFYISSEGYGVLINSPQRVKIHVGIGNRKDGNSPLPIDRTTGENWSARPLSDAVEASVQAQGLEVFLFSGRTPLEAVQRYNLFSGGGILPPKWGLGFWHRMHTRSSAQDVIREIKGFEEHNFPVDVIGLEPGWQDFAYPCSFDWDANRFPDPEKFVKTLSDHNIKVNLWENPYVAPSSTMFGDIKLYTGSHTVWGGEVPDYTMPAARKIMLDHHQSKHLDLGISGYKIDEVDGYDFWLWPDHATFPSGHDAVEIRQLFGLIMQDMLGDHFHKQNKRTYGLVRASYIGASSKPFVLYSDYYGHEGYVTALANSSLAGVLWCPEIRDAKSAEEWIRRFQTVCFSPMMMLNAWASGKKPWSYPEAVDMVRDVIELRQKLLPYLYTAFYQYKEMGIPPFRAMVLENGFESMSSWLDGNLDHTKNPYGELQRVEVTDQYMMGPGILVAPVFAGQKERNVVLPSGRWFDFYTGAYVGDDQTISIITKLDQIPLFVKDGSIIPMLSNLEGNELTDELPLEVRHYGLMENTYVLYNDDGESFDYENGEYSLVELKAARNDDGSLQGHARLLNENGSYKYGSISWKWMTPTSQE